MYSPIQKMKHNATKPTRFIITSFFVGLSLNIKADKNNKNTIPYNHQTVRDMLNNPIDSATTKSHKYVHF